MKLAIMQPYFLPYIGYFQLIKAVDIFIIYNNIKYTKKGWINRNRLLTNGTDKVFSLSLRRDSDFLDIVEREISPDFNPSKILNKFKGAYSCAPYFSEILPLLEQVISYEDPNLFRFIHHSLVIVCKYLNINTEIKISSDIAINHELKNQDKVIALCKAMVATTYINLIGGSELYSKDTFKTQGIELKFIKPKPFEYKQFNNDFVPWLSIIDVLMFNSVEKIKDMLQEYELT